MTDIYKRASDLQAALQAALERIGFDNLVKEQKELATRAAQSDFWQDNLKAQVVVKRQSKLVQRLGPWQNLKKNVDELVELSNMNDESLQSDVASQLDAARRQFESLKDELKFSGPFDEHDVILGIYAGAGGTDAQDWASMLMRMYVRWAEKHHYEVKTIDESPGDEAGLKSITMELSGNFLYGKLKGEHGVHRLVRLSPFNADHLRQTSFAKVDILPKIDRPEDVAVDDKDLRIDVYHSGGHGGQSVNTTDSAVRVTHLPTGIAIAIQNERSQLQNKETALTILRSRLAQLQLEQHLDHLDQLKGPNQSAEWGNQIRSFVLHPYKQVKDLRSRYETSDVEGVLNGNLDEIIAAYLEYNLGK